MSNYKYEGYGVIRDLKDDIPYHTDDIVDLLEEKDTHIAELEQQLKSQPAEIVEKIKGRFLATCRIEQGNDEMIASFQTFNRCLDTILKEYQK